MQGKRSPYSTEESAGGRLWLSQATPKAKAKASQDSRYKIQRRTQRGISMNDSAQLTSIPTCTRLFLLFEMMILRWIAVLSQRSSIQSKRIQEAALD
jgi:hypothetical protein